MLWPPEVHFSCKGEHSIHRAWRALPRDLPRVNSLGHLHVARLAGEVLFEQRCDPAARLLQLVLQRPGRVVMLLLLHKAHHMLQLTLLHAQRGRHATLPLCCQLWPHSTASTLSALITLHCHHVVSSGHCHHAVKVSCGQWYTATMLL